MAENAEKGQAGVDNPFVRLSAVDVRPMLSQKGNFTYLSWPFAVNELRKVDPTATWEVKRFDGLPYLQTELGFFVEVEVTVGGIGLSQVHPVIDSGNRPLLAPNAFDVNRSIQRCLVKAIALHGLGLSVYAGEDLNGPGEPSEPPAPPPAAPAAAAPARRRAALKQVGSGLSPQQQDEVRNLVKQTGADMKRLLDYYAVESLADIRATQFDRVMRSLQNHRKAA